MRTWTPCISVRDGAFTLTLEDNAKMAPSVRQASCVADLTSAEIDVLIAILQAQQKTMKQLAGAVKP